MNYNNLNMLSRLYGGMNKYAAADFSNMPFQAGGPQHQALVELAKKKIITEEQLNQALNGGQVDPGSPIHQALVATLPNTAPANAEEAAKRIAANNTMFAGVRNPNLLDKSMDWIKANPGLAAGIGAGALGLGGLGAYALMGDDEEEEKGRKKSAGYIDPYVAQVLAHDYITKMASANGIPSVAAGVTGLGNYINMYNQH